MNNMCIINSVHALRDITSSRLNKVTHAIEAMAGFNFHKGVGEMPKAIRKARAKAKVKRRVKIKKKVVKAKVKRVKAKAKRKVRRIRRKVAKKA